MFTRRVCLRSLAKINLDLRVLNKRPDGFHELRTLFQTVSLADIIDIEFTPARRTTFELDSALDIPDNLILRAAECVLRASKAKGGLVFRLAKRIPMGGGLGGGSSNAAAILLALPVLTGKPLSIEALLEMGTELGSDVPFFLFGGTAIGVGRGAELYPCPEPPAKLGILVTPGVHVSTAEAYRGLGKDLTGGLTSRNIEGFQSLAWRMGDDEPVKDWNVVNDFEAVVFGHYPQLKAIKGKLLKLGAKPALMSGSGSTLFGIFETRATRDAAAEILRADLGPGMVHLVSLVSRRGYRAMWRRQLRAHIAGEAWPPQSRYVT